MHLAELLCFDFFTQSFEYATLKLAIFAYNTRNAVARNIYMDVSKKLE